MGKTRNSTGNGIDLVKGYGEVVSSPTITPIAKAAPVSPTTSPTRNLEIPIAICITGAVYLALLYSVIWYLE